MSGIIPTTTPRTQEENKNKVNFSSQHDTFQRSPHDKQNPYTMISRNLIRDESISPECRWFLIYLLSNAEGWVIRVPQIINHLKGRRNFGTKRIYKIVNEAIQAGYIQREFIYEKNLRRGCKYLVYENPTNSNNFSDVALYDVSASAAHKKYQEEKDILIRGKEILKEKEKPPLPPKGGEESASPPPKDFFASKEIPELVEYFISKLKELNPKMLEPDKKKWAREMDKLSRIDKRAVDEIKKMIDWAMNDSFWYKNILSPKKLRKQWDQLFLRMTEPKKVKEPDSQAVMTNKSLANEVLASMIKLNRYSEMKIYGSGVSIPHAKEFVKFDINPATFKLLLLKFLNLKEKIDGIRK
jgi:hypothetical protein